MDINHTRENNAAASLLQFQEKAARRLLESESQAALELLTSETLRAEEFKLLYLRLLSEAADHRQLMGWMSGQYSVDTSICDDIAERDFDIVALHLKDSQISKSVELKNVRKQSAANLKEVHRNEAMALIESQKLPWTSRDFTNALNP